MLQATLLDVDFAGSGPDAKWNRHSDLRNVSSFTPHCVNRRNVSSPGFIRSSFGSMLPCDWDSTIKYYPIGY